MSAEILAFIVLGGICLVMFVWGVRASVRNRADGTNSAPLDGRDDWSDGGGDGGGGGD